MRIDPSTLSSRKVKLPSATSAPAYWLMMISVGITIPIILSLIAIFMALTYEFWMWVFGAFAGLFILIGITLFLTGLGIAIYLTTSRQWHAFVGWWLDRLARLKDRFSSVRSSTRLIRKELADTETGSGFFISMAEPQRFPKRPIERLTFEDDRHVTMIAASRAGKGRSFIIPNLAGWKGSTICYDPAGENYKITAKYRREVLGQKVVLLDPFGVTGDKTDYWNPMLEVDFETDPLAVDKCHMFAESLHADQTADPYWMHAPRKLIAMLIAFVGTRAIREQMNLKQVRDLLMSGDPSVLWTAMSRSDAFGGLIRRFAESNEYRHQEELASTMEIARTAMKWLDSGVMAESTAASTFSMKELKNGNVSVYIVLPAALGETYKSWTRMLFNAAFDAMQDLSIPKPEHSTLFVLDEFPLLGRMDRIKRAAGEAAKFGVKLFICAQDIGQLKEQYGHEAWETFIANSGTLIMFSNNDLNTQQYLSARLGREYYKAYSHSSGSGGSSSSYSMQLREVARPDQVEKIASRQSGDAYVFMPGAKPLLIKRANYDQWDMLAIPEGISATTSRSAANSNSNIAPVAAE